MGLFTNNKKPCPICGEGTPRLLATQIAGDTPICSSCSAKISMVNQQIGNLSVEELKEHLNKREENAKYLESTFRPNKKVAIGWTSLNIDEDNKTFTLPLNMCGDTKNPPVFKFEELRGYELLEDLCVIEHFNKGDRMPSFSPVGYTPVFRFNNQDEDESPKMISRNFTLKLYLSNPLWDMVESSGGSASASENNFQREYNKQLNELRVVTNTLASMIGISGSDTSSEGRDGQSNVSNIAEDLKKFKELLDGGIITQEEFNAKKKQLLNL